MAQEIEEYGVKWVQACACDPCAAVVSPFRGAPACAGCGQRFITSDVAEVIQRARDVVHALVVAIELGETPALEPALALLKDTGGLPQDLAPGA